MENRLKFEDSQSYEELFIYDAKIKKYQQLILQNQKKITKKISEERKKDIEEIILAHKHNLEEFISNTSKKLNTTTKSHSFTSLSQEIYEL